LRFVPLTVLSSFAFGYHGVVRDADFRDLCHDEC